MSAKRKPVIAIDGPAGAGKSTIARALAEKLGYVYVDTGAMYRAVAWRALKEKVSLDSPEELAALARSTRLRFARDGKAGRLLANGEDVSRRIRTQRVSQATSVLAAVPGVRRVLVKLQREWGRRGRVVMEGRDIGTAVFPDAEAKFYLDASPLERARRRYKELRAKNKRVNLKAIADGIRRRDARDKARPDSPLRAASDALVIDSTRLSQSQVVELISKRILERRTGKAHR